MPDAPFHQLLDATIRHLEDLREDGVRYVTVDARTLTELAQPPRSPAPRVPPAPLRPPAPSPTALPMPRPTNLSRPAPSPAPASAPPVQPRLPATEPPRGELTREGKESAMAALRQRVLACRKCTHLADARTQVVFGVGDIHSPLMFVGEAPGADEDQQGEPFVGKAGQLLTRIIQTMGLTRETVYIANILKCRPDTPGQSAGNRKPTPTEMVTCLPYLLEQIGIIRPRVIVALGATAMEGLFGKTDGITRVRGRWLTFQDTPVMPTYHPAYLLRNQALSEKRKVWEDMLAVLTRLGLPITEKQRGYFLKA